MRSILIFSFLMMLLQSVCGQQNFQIQNIKSGKIKTFDIGDKIVFKKQGNDLLHIGKLDSVTSTSFVVSGAEIKYTELSYITKERKWRKRLKPIAAVGLLAGKVWSVAGGLWTIAGIGGNPRYLLTGPMNLMLGNGIKFASLLPFIVREGQYSIPDKWQVVGAAVNTDEEIY